MMDEFLHMLVFFEDSNNHPKFVALTEILLNSIITSETVKGIKPKLLEKVHPDNLLVRYFDYIENDQKKFIDPCFEALKYLYDFLANKSAFFEKNFAKTLVEYLGKVDSWPSKAPDALILATKMLEDPTLKK